MGVIDSDYYNNEKNEGHIMIAIENTSEKDVELNKGDRIVQGIFVKYLTATNETTPIDIRSGGIGSTRK
jgi:dUTP pyrophosphatase